MDKEEKYWSNLEKLYVHNVYEKISHRYDEFLRMSMTREVSYDYDEQSSDAETTTTTTTTTTTKTYTTTKTTTASNNQNENSQKITVTTKAESVIKNGCCVYHHLHGNQLTLDLNNNNQISKNNSSNANSHIVCNFKTSNSPILKFKQRNFRNLRHSKHSPWPKVKNFILNLDRYSLIADVGCGDGKYLNVNNHILSIGSDRSVSLCKLASLKTPPVQSVTNQSQIIVCDNLALPFKSDYFDAVISIGVIHHFSTEKRRIRAIQELARILRPGGKIMIYVWALEQKLRKFNSQDVLVPMIDAAAGSNIYKSSGDVKYRLRRDLSNNSTAESEDSNNEDALEKSLVKFNKNKTIAPFSYSPENKSPALNDLGDVFSNDDTKMDQNDENLDTRSPNFVENLKRFFARKFQIGSGSGSDSNLVASAAAEKKPETLRKSATGTSEISMQRSMTDDSDPVELYKRIIDEHRDKLPENFTVRRFPSSSCPDTFEESVDGQIQESISPINITTTSSSPPPPPPPITTTTTTTNPPILVADSTSSPSLTPSPINQYAPPHSYDETYLNSSTRSEEATSNDGGRKEPDENNNRLAHSLQGGDLLHDLNQSNKRFYHVFKRDELDDLIKSYCPSLKIYDSYYDHGNWCICAIKDNLDNSNL